MQNEAEVEYWSKNKDEVLTAFQTSQSGLSEREILTRRKKYGYNQLRRKKYVLLILLRQFKNPLLWLLIVASVLSMFFGELIGGIIIITLIVLSALVTFIQEYRSEKIIEDLNKKISHKVIVIRNGEKIETDVKLLVPGDLVHLDIGTKVPADLRIIDAENFEINESVLTGESMPARKISDALSRDDKSGNYQNYAFAGTIVSDGEALGVVLATGNQTRLGKLSKEVVQEKPQIEFQKGISKFVNFLIKVVLILTVVIFAANAILKQNVLDSLLFALAIAIGMAPEMLPVILTVSMSLGAKIMSKKEVIVKRLISIEDFGNMDVLCTDKTGTITEGNIKLDDYFDINNRQNEDILLYGLLCNSAISHGKKISGNPIDAAILQHSNEKLNEQLHHYSKVEEIPFDYERKRMSVVVSHGKSKMLITKGAVLPVLNACSKINLGGRVSGIASHKKKIGKKFMDLSNQGLRVISVAYKPTTKNSHTKNDEKEMIFLGFLVLSDPPRKDAREALEKLKSLNINFKILTGDNEIVTKKIAEEVGISVSAIVLGEDIEKASGEKLNGIVESANIFCRLTPEQKQKIIKTLKDLDHDVGYMGDGVNDIAALHEADVGISVDSAVDVAKDASDIILLKKSLGTLADGVLEGRKIFGNSIKYILMGVSSDFGNMLSMSISSFFLPFLPMLPTQVLLNDLLYDFSQFPISSDNVDSEYMKRPKKFNLSLIRRFMLWFGPISSLYDFITFGVMIFLLKFSDVAFRTGWFIESVATQTLIVFVIRTRRSPFWKSRPAKGILISCLSIVAAALIIPYTPLGTLFGLEPMPLFYFIFLIGAVITYILLVEVGKRIFFKKYEI
ncbi:MAG: magnesium-translocating P-type ATPase [Nanoarchaeota archaeon]|nr:magnesium-translocating P-type ATPase [Nanoarchaeota archaeon]